MMRSQRQIEESVRMKQIYDRLCEGLDGESPHLVMPVLVQVMSAVLNQFEVGDGDIDGACVIIDRQLRAAYAEMKAREVTS